MFLANLVARVARLFAAGIALSRLQGALLWWRSKWSLGHVPTDGQGVVYTKKNTFVEADSKKAPRKSAFLVHITPKQRDESLTNTSTS